MTRARDVALKVLGRVEQDGAFAAAALASELSNVNDPREAAFATELVLGVLRRRSILDDLLEKISTRGLSRLNPMARNILRIGAYQIIFLDRVPISAAVSQAVDQTRNHCSKGLVGLVNALLRKISKKEDWESKKFDLDNGGSIEDASVRLGIPKWIMKSMVSSKGRDGAFATAQAFNSPSRRTLRVNVNRISRDEVLSKLGSAAKAGELTPWSVDISNRRKAASLFDEGLAVYQDEGAQLAAMAIDPEPGDRILDACAGRGGKTSALAMITDGAANIIATDRGGNKLDRLCFELDRQGFKVETIAADLIKDTEKLGGGYNRVLLDAPCSGTGTMGRRPEIRWRIEPSAVESLSKIQASMMVAAASLVAPGGRLVYAVCSLMPEEGNGQAKHFLENNKDFHYTKDAPKDWPVAVPWQKGSATLDPGVHGTDGYQIFSFTRD